MLTKIHVENYKGFKEAEIPIKPITILLGANSSGKSSILQLLLLLQQTAEETSNSYKSALKILGNRTSVGKPENLFYGLDRKIPICIQIDFNNEQLYKHLQDALGSFLTQLSIFYFSSEYKFEGAINDRDLFKRSLEKELEQVDTKRHWGEEYVDLISEQDVFNKDSEALIRNYDFLTNIKNEINNSSFSFNYSISYYRKHLIISSFSLQQGDTSILSYRKNAGFSSGLVDLNGNDNACLKSSFSENATLFSLFKNKTVKKTSLSKTIISFINLVLSILRNEFREPFINHVSPLRAHPQRYYMLDKSNVTYSLDTYDANAIAEVIKDKLSLKLKVNTWFEQFGLTVNVDEFKEAIHKLTVDQSGLSLDIPDVGFGVSQVLPVVLQGFLSPNKSVTIVEQPEVHLHPKMQAALADLFIDIAKESKYSKHLIIETHSEYLLKRLRRRMAEGENISPDRVSINLFHTRTESTPATIENLSIESRGAFEWPKEYYDDELYDDIVKFLELQGDGDLHTNN